MSIIETPRLWLRRWRESDFEPFAALNADPQVMEYYPAVQSREESRGFMRWIEEKFDSQGFGFWVMEEKHTGEFLGFTGLNIPSYELPCTPCVEIGWRLARRYWGNGYVTEAGQHVLDYAFSTAGLDKVYAWTYEGNKRSRAVMERLGMQRRPEYDFGFPRLPEDHPLRPHVVYGKMRQASR